MSGVKVDDTPDSQVTMVTVSGQPQDGSRGNNSNINQSYRNSRPQRQDRKGRQDTDGPPVTECSFCGLIRDKDVPQECLSMNFKDRHRIVSSKPIYPNDCLAWMNLSLDDREKVLHNNELQCKMCLRALKPGSRGSMCSKGSHTINNGRNGMCFRRNCEKHSTVCKENADENKNRHRIVRQCLEWAQGIRPQASGQTTSDMTFLMTVNEDVESSSEKELDDMNDMRKEIHINTSTDTMDIFGYTNMDDTEQTTLVIVEDRRNNEAQFDLAYVDIDGEEILTAFDSCSDTTLIHKELVNEGKVKVIKTQDSSNIKGIGGTAKGKVVTMDLTNRYGTRIRINASVVDEIATIKKKDKARYELLIKESTEEVKRQEGYENITRDNFQLVPGGKIQLLIGLDVGNDFFPKEISTFRSGLKVSEHRMKLSNPGRFLGFSGSFPAHFTSMYSPKSHPRALLMQECPQQLQEEEKSVFQVTASAQKKR